jgi:hypothetical protein
VAQHVRIGGQGVRQRFLHFWAIRI